MSQKTIEAEKAKAVSFKLHRLVVKSLKRLVGVRVVRTT
jgi:hypothetical protein